MSQRRHRRFFGNEGQVRVKRRGKSSPLAKQFARQEKPHAVQDRTEGGQPVRTPRILSGLTLGYRRITVPPLRDRAPSTLLEKVLGEINDHPPKKFGDRIRLIAIEMEGAFGNEGALPLYAPLTNSRTLPRRKPDRHPGGRPARRTRSARRRWDPRRTQNVRRSNSSLRRKWRSPSSLDTQS